MLLYKYGGAGQLATLARETPRVDGDRDRELTLCRSIRVRWYI